MRPSHPRLTRSVDLVDALHWATLQLAASLIDYVIVHELAHLEELNHTDRYWAEVARAMPDYERRRDELTIAGVTIWTCRG